MEPLNSALSVLTAMITPAVLISACGALILSTSTRLGRVVDRVRMLIDRFEEMVKSGEDVELYEERRAATFDQLDRLTTRSRLLQRSMTVFSPALGVFVATSVSIGLIAAAPAWHDIYAWIPVVFGLVGSCGLFYGSVLLVFEARLAQSSLNAEMDFTWKLGRALAPPDLRNTRSPHFNPLTLKRKP